METSRVEFCEDETKVLILIIMEDTHGVNFYLYN